MTNKKPLALVTCALASALLLSACSLEEGGDLDQPRGALLYDLSEDEVEQIHAQYAGDEDYESFRERLVAPFECSLYGDLCAQVGAEGAQMLTAEMVDLALEGTPLAELEAHVDEQLEALAPFVDEDDEAELEGFRAAGSWATHTSGNYRLRVRNGISTPLFGDRRAWTEARTQKKSLGIWSNKAANQLCVNAGTNTQTQTVVIFSPTHSIDTYVFETRNPANACSSSISSRTISTYHDRRHAGGGDVSTWSYEIEAKGCASAQINGLYLSRCASDYSKSF